MGQPTPTQTPPPRVFVFLARFQKTVPKKQTNARHHPEAIKSPAKLTLAGGSCQLPDPERRSANVEVTHADDTAEKQTNPVSEFFPRLRTRHDASRNMLAVMSRGQSATHVMAKGGDVLQLGSQSQNAAHGLEPSATATSSAREIQVRRTRTTIGSPQPVRIPSYPARSLPALSASDPEIAERDATQKSARSFGGSMTFRRDVSPNSRRWCCSMPQSPKADNRPRLKKCAWGDETRISCSKPPSICIPRHVPEDNRWLRSHSTNNRSTRRSLRRTRIRRRWAVRESRTEIVVSELN